MNAPTPREQELEAQLEGCKALYNASIEIRENLEAQNKALRELVEEAVSYADAMYDGTGPWPKDKQEIEAKLVTIQKAKEAKV
jgi:hypothetical protein